jgi:hypothetical protein
MFSVTNVHRGFVRGKVHSGFLHAQRAAATLLWGDVLGIFTTTALRARLVRLNLVSPRLAETDHDRLKLLVRHTEASGAEIVVLTQPSASPGTSGSLEFVRWARAHRVLTKDLLHANLYVCQEERGRGVALIGSANLTRGGSPLAEVGVLFRPLRRSRVIDWARVAITYLGGQERAPAWRTA